MGFRKSVQRLEQRYEITPVSSSDKVRQSKLIGLIQALARIRRQGGKVVAVGIAFDEDTIEGRVLKIQQVGRKQGR